MMSLERFRHYTIGVPEIDAEHWELCALLNEAFKFAKDRDAEALKKLVKELSAKLQEHFENEESAMADKSYPWLAAHIEDHQRMMRAMDRFLRRANDECYSTLYFSSDLEELLMQHIDQQDRQYEHFICK